jgi:hydrogenase maturation protein HypF
MRNRGRILIRGIVQGVGFRPFVYARATDLGIRGTVRNTGSQVEIDTWGDRFPEFLAAVSRGPPMARIDSVQVEPLDGDPPPGFAILQSTGGALSGLIPPEIATCRDCIGDIFAPSGRYGGYWATSCVNCGPRYSIIRGLPYDRERTSMAEFPMCPSCAAEYSDPSCRRHHAQTIACPACGPQLSLRDGSGSPLPSPDPVGEAARLLDNGRILAIRGIGGFHLACTGESAGELKRRLGRTEQPFAVMVTPEHLERIARVSPEDREWLESPVRPILVLPKRDPDALPAVSNLHTIGCMLPYAPLHHLLFARLSHPLLVMTSANHPGYPMVTETDEAVEKLAGSVDFILSHNRLIVNRCDDSVIRDGFIIRVSRGIAPKRTRIDLGPRCILGVGPELNSNITVYTGGFAVTSPHIGHVRNPPTLTYLQETVERIGRFLGASYDVIAHDLHPQFLSTRFAREMAAATGAALVPVQHHRAHVAAVTTDPCIGITIDGVGYGDDSHVWGGEVFAGQVPDLDRVAHLEEVPMPGGDLATRFPERMLYGILPGAETRSLLAGRGWDEIALGVLDRQVDRSVNVAWTSSTGRVLDAVAAMLGACRERTYDGEPAMRLESLAVRGTAREWPLEYGTLDGCRTLSTRALCRLAFREYTGSTDLALPDREKARADIAASVQYNMARGLAALAADAARERGIPTVVLSGGVAYNRAIRETIRDRIRAAGLTLLMNPEYPLGDGCISYGQCVWAGTRER